MTCYDCSTSEATCTTCGSMLCAEHRFVGHPLITMRQLFSTIYTTALRAPGMLGEILFKELDQVVYCDTCRDAVAGRRQTEQLKFVSLMLLVILVVIALPTYMMLA